MMVTISDADCEDEDDENVADPGMRTPRRQVTKEYTHQLAAFSSEKNLRAVQKLEEAKEHDT